MNTREILRKSAADRKIDGICGGIARYFGIDSSLVRIGWILLTIAGGVGVVLYLLAMVIMPSPDPLDASPRSRDSMPGGYLIAGVLLMVVGLVWLLGSMGFLSLHTLSLFSWKAILPIVLVLAGIALIVKRSGSSLPHTGTALDTGNEVRRFYRSRREKKLFGVCGGIGVYFDIDPVIVRILSVSFVFFFPVVVILAYLLLSIFVREEPLTFAV